MGYPPSLRQLAYAISLGIRVSPTHDKDALIQLIDRVTDVQDRDPATPLQIQLAEAWDVKLDADSTIGGAANRLFNTWEKNPELEPPVFMRVRSSARPPKRESRR